MHIVIRPLVLLSEKTRHSLGKLHIRGDSSLLMLLRDAKQSIKMVTHPELFEPKYRSRFRKRGLNKRIVGILAKEGSDILGWVGFKKSTVDVEKFRTIRYLSVGIFVHPRYRRTGVSKQLMAATEKYAINNGFDALKAYPYNDRGVKFFSSCGFFIERDAGRSYGAFKILSKT